MQFKMSSRKVRFSKRSMSSADKKSPDTAAKNDADNTIIISTDSGSFASWTLVTENNKNLINYTKKDERDNHGVEDVEEEEEEVDDDDIDNHELGEANDVFNELKSLEDNSLDELSDGISIISESESSGRLSPHPALRQYLGEFTSKFIESPDYDSARLTTSLNVPMAAMATSAQTNFDSENKLRQRKRSPTSSTSQAQALQPVESNSGAVYPSTPLHTIRKSLKGLFYFGVALGLVGFVGRLFLPGWAPAPSTEPLQQLVQKFNDMELQNNLMRAEIDLLTKQINYLSSLNEQSRKVHDGPTPGHGQASYKDYKTKGLKSNSKDNDATKGEFSNNEFKREREAPAAPEFETINGNSPHEQKSENSPATEDLPANAQENKNQHRTFQNNGNVYNRKRMEDKFNKDYSNKRGNKASKEESIYSKEFLKEHRNRDGDNNGDRSNSRERHHHGDDDHFQRKTFTKQPFRDDAKERFDKKNRNYARNNVQKREGSSKEKKNGDWHENYMHHRANERHSSEKKRNDKNWFIERGNSREQMRHR